MKQKFLITGYRPIDKKIDALMKAFDLCDGVCYKFQEVMTAEIDPASTITPEERADRIKQAYEALDHLDVVVIYLGEG